MDVSSDPATDRGEAGGTVRLVLAGGSGALGRRIADDFAARGHDVVILTRHQKPDVAHRQVIWDGRTVGEWSRELSGAVLVNLAGEIVDRPPTRKNIELLRSSRVEPTEALRQAAAELDEQPRVWVQSSTAAIYGDRGDEELTEESAVGDGPPQMADVARAWEAAADNARTERQVLLRAAVVFESGTRAFERLRGMVRWGLGGRVGNGQQWVSWLHIEDYLAILRTVIDSDLHGVINASSPNPVRNKDLMAQLRGVLHRPPAPPTPAFAVRLGAPLLRTDPELALLGRRCLPRRLLDSGFEFRHPNLPDALDDLVRS